MYTAIYNIYIDCCA